MNLQVSHFEQSNDLFKMRLQERKIIREYDAVTKRTSALERIFIEK